MKKVKFFYSDDADKLQEIVNDWLSYNNMGDVHPDQFNITVGDMQMSNGPGGVWFFCTVKLSGLMNYVKSVRV